jgi:hypothetical protein
LSDSRVRIWPSILRGSLCLHVDPKKDAVWTFDEGQLYVDESWLNAAVSNPAPVQPLRDRTHRRLVWYTEGKQRKATEGPGARGILDQSQ